jgi:cytochrome b6-f complex iron-sulfur subunit
MSNEITPRPTQQPAYGAVHGPPVGEITRRKFMRRAHGVGVGLLSIEFVAGTLAFLWPQIREGLGTIIPLGTAETVLQSEPGWSTGTPLSYQAARLFFINVPAAMAFIEGREEEVPDPGANVEALFRKCPHLGCQIPPLCEQSLWFECLCHGSKYTILGEHRDGPAPRGMDRFEVTVEDGVYMIDTTAIIDGPPVGTVTFDDRTPGQMAHCT